MNQMKLQVIELPSYGVLRWCMKMELEEIELVHIPVSVNEDELARARAIVEITLHSIVEGAIVHDLVRYRLLPHPDLHVFSIDQMALMLLSWHWDVDGRLSCALRLIINLDRMRLPCHNLLLSNRHHW